MAFLLLNAVVDKYQGMDHLNVVLAEIERAHPHMDSKLAWVSQLRQLYWRYSHLLHPTIRPLLSNVF